MGTLCSVADDPAVGLPLAPEGDLFPLVAVRVVLGHAASHALALAVSRAAANAEPQIPLHVLSGDQ